jgi:hypothetical protein
VTLVSPWKCIHPQGEFLKKCHTHTRWPTGGWCVCIVECEHDSYIMRVTPFSPYLNTSHINLKPSKKTPPKLENITKINGLLLIDGWNPLRSKEKTIKLEASQHFGVPKKNACFFPLLTGSVHFIESKHCISYLYYRMWMCMILSICWFLVDSIDYIWYAIVMS